MRLGMGTDYVCFVEKTESLMNAFCTLQSTLNISITSQINTQKLRGAGVS